MQGSLGGNRRFIQNYKLMKMSSLHRNDDTRQKDYLDVINGEGSNGEQDSMNVWWIKK